MRIRQAVYLSEQGAQRRSNQDGVLSLHRVPLYAVADGAGGEEAARTVLTLLKEQSALLAPRIAAVASAPTTTTRLAVSHFFKSAIGRANQALLAKNGDAGGQLASTLVAATFVGAYAFIAHVGDSRAYLLRKGELRLLTRDHTLAALQLARGDLNPEEYEASPFRSTLSQSLGTGPSVDPDVAEIRLAADDVLLLCSNGLHRFTTPERIAHAIDADDLEASARRLVAVSTAAGAPDNTTVVLVSIAPEERPDVAPEQLERVVREAFLFRGLADPEWMQVAPYLEEVRAAKDEVLVEADREAKAFYVVAHGAVEVRQGAEVRELGPGDHFGALALASGGRPLDTARALDPTQLLALTRERFEQLVREHPALGTRLALAILESLGDHLGVYTTRLAKVIEAVHGEHRA